MHIQLIYPHQLFKEHLSVDKDTEFICIEDDLLFREYPFHKQKLVLHRASMLQFSKQLREQNFTVHYITSESKHKSQDRLLNLLRELNATQVSYYDPVDNWLDKRTRNTIQMSGATSKRLESPNFLTTLADIEQYFAGKQPRMQHFYVWQRKQLNILVESNGSPTGGAWSFDHENRKKIPKGISIPDQPSFSQKNISDYVMSIERDFTNNPGNTSSFNWPTTHEEAERLLEYFLKQRFAQFGPYEDAILTNESFLYHATISGSLNCGLLNPKTVIAKAIQYAALHKIPIASLEGFIRQIIGWREYMRATYWLYGSDMRTQNKLQLRRQLNNHWWDGTTGLDPVDRMIDRVHDTAYAHHIERLMIAGNAMLLLRIAPDEVYKWFMSLFIDAYDWVMVPNVYAMSQFAAGSHITTKPYISGSSYILKMSDYKRGDWSEAWDALYWEFIKDYERIFAANPRSSMMVRLYQKMDDERKNTLHQTAQKWLAE